MRPGVVVKREIKLEKTSESRQKCCINGKYSIIYIILLEINAISGSIRSILSGKYVFII